MQKHCSVWSCELYFMEFDGSLPEEQKIIEGVEGLVGLADLSYPHEGCMVKAVNNALQAVLLGNNGTGAIIVNDDTDKVVASGMNRRNEIDNPLAFIAHSEIDALSKFQRSSVLGQNFSMYPSLEPCGICTRAILAHGGIKNVYVGALDPAGASILSSPFMGLEPDWKRMIEIHGIKFHIAEISENLRKACADIFFEIRDFRREKILQQQSVTV